MHKTYLCKYCNKEYPSNQSRNGHQIHCKLNPNHAIMQDKIKRILRNKKYNYISKLKEYKLLCIKCNKQYTLKLTQNRYISGNYTKHCSRSCANGRTHSKYTKEKTSKTLTKNYTRIIYKNCIVCNKLMIFKLDSVRLTCSKECLHIFKSNHGKEVVKNGGGWKSRKIISYPQKFFMKVLNYNNIQYIHNYKVLKKQIDQNLNGFYFLDFYLPFYNIDLEIDGQQHKNPNAIIHDNIRDQILSKKYKVYRIQWNGVNNQKGKMLMKQKIDNFLNYITLI